MRYMLDTNICIYVMKGSGRSLLVRFREAAQDLCISSVTLAELYYGVEKSSRRAQNRAALESFVARLGVLPFGRSAALHFGEIRAVLEAAGTPCGPFDLQIGAHARSEGLIVVTNNRREFDRMPGVLVENWVASP